MPFKHKFILSLHKIFLIELFKANNALAFVIGIVVVLVVVLVVKLVVVLRVGRPV